MSAMMHCLKLRWASRLRLTSLLRKGVDKTEKVSSLFVPACGRSDNEAAKLQLDEQDFSDSPEQQRGKIKSQGSDSYDSKRRDFQRSDSSDSRRQGSDSYNSRRRDYQRSESSDSGRRDYQGSDSYNRRRQDFQGSDSYDSGRHYGGRRYGRTSYGGYGTRSQNE